MFERWRNSSSETVTGPTNTSEQTADQQREHLKPGLYHPNPAQGKAWESVFHILGSKNSCEPENFHSQRCSGERKKEVTLLTDIFLKFKMNPIHQAEAKIFTATLQSSICLIQYSKPSPPIFPHGCKFFFFSESTPERSKV